MTDKTPLRIAMWSGPRNISSVMMRSWGNRADTAVIDEPFYAYYLKNTGVGHPGREAVIASQSTDWQEIADVLTGPVPGGKPVWYQKHMAHHLLPMVGRDWLDGLTHAFLIRHPREMLGSLIHFVPEPRLEDTGFPQQVALFREITQRTGTTPPVVAARDVLENPEGMQRKLCETFGLPFDPAMMQWEPGLRDTDGVWGKDWYRSLEKSTTFLPYRPRDNTLPSPLIDIHDACIDLYNELAEHRLQA